MFNPYKLLLSRLKLIIVIIFFLMFNPDKLLLFRLQYISFQSLPNF